MTKIEIKLVDYDRDLEAIQKIRTLVFHEEQGIPKELEFDDRDEDCLHLLAYLNEEPVGTVRIRTLDRGIAKIERLAVLKWARGQGIGQKLLEIALNFTTVKEYRELVINAQEYVKNLYQKLGFQQVGNSFEEAGISHVKMIKKLSYDSE